MLASIFAAGQPPGKKAIDGAEENVTCFRSFAKSRNVFEKPYQFEAAEVRRDRQAGLAPDRIFARRESLKQRLGTRVLPHERVRDRRAGFAIPQHRCFPLVGNADRSEILRPQCASRDRFVDDLQCPPPDLFSIVLYPSGTRIDLLVLTLCRADNAT